MITFLLIKYIVFHSIFLLLQCISSENNCRMTGIHFRDPKPIQVNCDQNVCESQPSKNYPRKFLASTRMIIAIACIVGATILLIIGIMLLIWSSTPSAKNNLLLVSYDGFRWDYIQKHLKNLPTYQALMESGAWSRNGMKNAFATKTAPNHYVMATGLYEESNGIVGNDFWDPVLGRFDYWSKKSKTNPRFFLGEPIWVTNQFAGRKSGCVMWASCDVAIKGQRSSNYISLNEKMPWEKRLDQIITWFTDPDDPINLGVLYIEQPDLYGHKFGPDSKEIGEMLVKLDTFTKLILDKLEQHSLLDRTNIILTSDHGMTSTPKQNSVDLSKYLNKEWINASYGGSPNANIQPAPGYTDKVVAALSKAEHITVYKKDQIPPEYHYHNSDRILPIQVFADMHWRIVGSFIDVHRSNGLMGIDGNEVNMGDHGYNNSEPDMHPYFIATGPNFARNYVKEAPFENVDLYPLMCHLLGLRPAPNNGTLSRVQDLLNEGYDLVGGLMIFTTLAFIVLAWTSLITLLLMTFFRFYNRRKEMLMKVFIR